MKDSPRRRRRNQPLVVALWVNAALLAGILVAVMGRGDGVGSKAMAAAAPAMPGQVPQPIAGGNGFYLMPAQFSQFIWGCYVMDTDQKKLVAYEYVPSNRQLRLAAVRGFEQDLQLDRFNTTPDPVEIKRMIDMQKAGVRGQPVAPGGPVEPPAGPGPGGNEGPATRPVP